MSYKLELITDPAVIAGLITKTEDKLFELNTDRNVEITDEKNELKAVNKKVESIALAEARRDAAIAAAANLPADSPLRAKQLGIVETQKARLFNLTLPGGSNGPTQVVDSAIEAGELNAVIAFYEGVLQDLNTRKTEIESGNP
jgi:hypothetical protein